MKGYKTFALLAILLSFCLILGGCGGGGASTSGGSPTSAKGEAPGVGGESAEKGEGNRGGQGPSDYSVEDVSMPTATTKTVLNAASYSDPKNLNPWITDGKNSSRIVINVFERLVDHNAAGDDYYGVLAESWTDGEDGITFNLRKGVKFHDGQEMKANDVVFSLKTASLSPSANGNWNWIDWENIEAKDDYTVWIPYHYPCGLTLAKFASNNMYVLCEATYEEYGDGISQHANGTGPFKVADWLQGDHITLSRFEEYWDQKPVLETVNFRFIAEASQASIELETGGVDLLYDIAALDIPKFQTSDTMKMFYAPPLRNDFLHLNCSKPGLDNPKVRQAIAYALSQEDILTGVFRNQSNMAYSCVTPAIVGYSDEFEGSNYPYGTAANLEKAQQLLSEAGFADGLSLQLTIDDDPNRVATAEIIKNNLGKAGIEVSIISQDFATLWERIYANDTDMWMLGINANSYEPDHVMFLRWHSDNIHEKAGSNYSRFKNDELDKVLDDARASFDLAERKELYKRAQQIFTEEVPAIPYGEALYAYATAGNLDGLQGYGDAIVLKKCYFS